MGMAPVAQAPLRPAGDGASSRGRSNRLSCAPGGRLQSVPFLRRPSQGLRFSRQTRKGAPEAGSTGGDIPGAAEAWAGLLLLKIGSAVFWEAAWRRNGGVDHRLGGLPAHPCSQSRFCQNVHGLLCLQLHREDRLKAESGVVRLVCVLTFAGGTQPWNPHTACCSGKGNPLQGPRVGSHVLTKQETWLEGRPGGQQQGHGGEIYFHVCLPGTLEGPVRNKLLPVEGRWPWTHRLNDRRHKLRLFPRCPGSGPFGTVCILAIT
nr:uncharacterized protein LOC114112239 [Ovis aries]